MKTGFEYLLDALNNDREALEIFAEENSVDANTMADQTANTIRAEAASCEIKSAADAKHYCAALKSE